MDHVEVADLGEESPHSFSVVLAVSDGSGPAHKSDFDQETGNVPTGLRTDVNTIVEATALAFPEPWRSSSSANERRHRFLRVWIVPTAKFV